MLTVVVLMTGFSTLQSGTSALNGAQQLATEETSNKWFDKSVN